MKRTPNIWLLAVSLISILFGTYGFLFGGLLLGPQPPEHKAGESTAAEQPAKPAATTEQPVSAQPVDQESAPNPGQPGPAEPPPENASGRISGSVVDRHGTAVRGALVVAIDTDFLLEARPDLGAPREELLATLRGLESALDRHVHRATTDAAGRFVLEKLDETARFNLRATSAAHGSASHFGAHNGNDVRLEMTSPGFLEVMLLDADGVPVSHATVTKGSGEVRVRAMQRGKAGKYSVEWDSWLHWVTFTARGHLPSRRIPRAEIGAQEVRVQLKRASVLQGVVRDLAGNPVPGAVVRVVRVVSGAGDSGAALPLEHLDGDLDATADDHGRYVFDCLPPGRYTLRAGLSDPDQPDSQQQEVVVSGDTTANFTLDTGARATIEVRGAAGPLDFFFASFATLGGQDAPARALPPQGFARAFIGLPREVLRVDLSAFGYCPLVAEIDLTGGSASLSCTLEQGAMVTGRLLDSQGNPVEGMRVRLAPADAATDTGNHQWRSAEGGNFKFGPLPPGAWVADVFPRDFPTDKAASQAVQLRPGPNALDIVVRDLRSLRIRVTLSDSRYKGEVRVFLQREGAEHSKRFDLTEPSPVREHKATGLPRGRYFAHAWCEQFASPAVPVEVGDTEALVTLSLGQPDCLRITSVAEGSNAARAGLKDDDLILLYDGQPLSSVADLSRLTRASEGRQSVPLTILRNGKQLEVTVGGGLLGVTAMIACR